MRRDRVGVYAGRVHRRAMRCHGAIQGHAVCRWRLRWAWTLRAVDLQLEDQGRRRNRGRLRRKMRAVQRRARLHGPGGLPERRLFQPSLSGVPLHRPREERLGDRRRLRRELHSKLRYRQGCGKPDDCAALAGDGPESVRCVQGAGPIIRACSLRRSRKYLSVSERWPPAPAASATLSARASGSASSRRRGSR